MKQLYMSMCMLIVTAMTPAYAMYTPKSGVKKQCLAAMRQGIMISGALSVLCASVYFGSKHGLLLGAYLNGGNRFLVGVAGAVGAMNTIAMAWLYNMLRKMRKIGLLVSSIGEQSYLKLRNPLCEPKIHPACGNSCKS